LSEFYSSFSDSSVSPAAPTSKSGEISRNFLGNFAESPSFRRPPPTASSTVLILLGIGLILMSISSIVIEKLKNKKLAAEEKESLYSAEESV
jgi:hypothetical protein